MDYYTWNPGPGTYRPKIGETTTREPMYSLGIRFKDKLGDGPRPGPGTYNPHAELTMAREPAFSIQGRNAASLANNNPGAGEYTPSIKLTKREGQHAILGQKIDTSFHNDNPGPGTYKPQLIAQKPAFTCAKRFAAEVDQDFPGPGTYKAPYVDWYKPGFTLAKRFPTETSFQTPAPGTYNVRLPKDEWRKDGFTLGSRFTRDGDQGFVGPGNYDDNYKSKPPAYTIATRFVPKRSQNDNPGAGAYSPELPHGPDGFSFGLRTRDAIDHRYPGPGTYSPSLPSKKGQSIAVRFPEKSTLTITPGPGNNFNPKLDKWTGPAYSLAARGRDELLNHNPGPGTYTTPGVKGKGPLIATKLSKHDWNNVPGPGQYNLRGDPTDGLAFTIATRFKKKPRPGERGYIEPRSIA